MLSFVENKYKSYGEKMFDVEDLNKIKILFEKEESILTEWDNVESLFFYCYSKYYDLFDDLFDNTDIFNIDLLEDLYNDKKKVYINYKCCR